MSVVLLYNLWASYADLTFGLFVVSLQGNCGFHRGPGTSEGNGLVVQPFYYADSSLEICLHIVRTSLLLLHFFVIWKRTISGSVRTYGSHALYSFLFEVLDEFKRTKEIVKETFGIHICRDSSTEINNNLSTEAKFFFFLCKDGIPKRIFARVNEEVVDYA